MANNKYPILAREGWWHTAIIVGAAGTVHYFAGVLWALPLWVLSIFVIQFFRDPPRRVPANVRGIAAPADGRVIAVGDVEDPYLKRPAKRISIFMNVFNVHSNRSPVGGQIMERWYSPGSFLNAALDKASRENERNALWVKTDEGDDVVFVQVAGLIARRILCYVQPGSRIGQGERYGFIRFGSRVDVYLPPASRIEVALGDKVKGGTDIIAVLQR
jgi:phosphatidylserine decarboxylase